MKVDDVYTYVKNIPHMTVDQAKVITRFVIDNNCKNILELGFEHGVSTCYLAAALDEIGDGSITTIDLEDARDVRPNIEILFDQIKLSRFVKIYYEPTSYIWRLMRLIEQNPDPAFDLCYLDGAHTWFVDGFAFFLVDKLLKPGGWIIFDDLDWTFKTSPELKKSKMVKIMPTEEKETPQIRKVYELLVKPHPGYGEFMEKDGWAYARKSPINMPLIAFKKEIIHEKEYVGLGSVLLQIGRKILRSF